MGINLLVFDSVTRALGSDPPTLAVASAIAFAVAVCWNFLWNYLWTFRAFHGRRLEVHLGLFVGFSAVGLGINELVLYVLAPHSTPLIAQAIGIVAGSVVNFGLNARVNFQPIRAVGAAPPGLRADLDPGSPGS